MEIKLTHKPSYTQAYVILERGESLLVERDGMVQMSDGLDVSGGFGPGGAAKAALRKTLGGESLLMGRYTATYHNAWIAVSPRYPGDMAVIDLERLGGRGVAVEQGALVACAGPNGRHAGVDVDVRWAGVGSMLVREGMTMLRLSGHGCALIGSYGGIEAIPLADGETRFVDTGHLVGFTDDTRIQVGPLGGVVASGMTGEGLVAKLTGAPGGGSVIWTQTRSEQGLTGWLFPDKQQNTGRRR